MSVMLSKSGNTKIVNYLFILLGSGLLFSFQQPSGYSGGAENSADTPKVLFDHKDYKDFSKGTLSDFGASLYVSQKGNIQFINLFDLNADGFPEVVINNDHNHYETPDLLIYH